MKWLTRITALYDRFLDLTPVLASLLLYFTTAAVCYEVVMRHFFNLPTSWVTEITSLTLLWIPFLVAAWVFKRSGHVRMDLLLMQFSEKKQALINVVTFLVTALTCAVLIVYGVKMAWQMFQDGYRTETLLRLLKWPLLLIIPFGFLMLLVESLRKTAEAMKKWRSLGS
jgi:TRAP-type C4-dicarboxylate transport system permease small subunit